MSGKNNTSYAITLENDYVKLKFTNNEYETEYFPKFSMKIKTINNSTTNYLIGIQDNYVQLNYTLCTNVAGTDLDDFLTNLTSSIAFPQSSAALEVYGDVGVTNTVDVSGSSIGVTNTVETSVTGNVNTVDQFPQDVLAMGLNIYPGFETWAITGYRANISTSTKEIVHEGTLSGLSITFPTAAGQFSIASTDATDNIAGTGARTVFIFGLDSNGDNLFEVVALNGQTPVLTTNTYLRINRAFVFTAGSDLQNNGEICVSDAAQVWSAGSPTTLLYHDIAATVGWGQVGTYTIPYNITTSVVGNLVFTSNANASKSLEFFVESRRRDTGSGTAWLNPVHLFISSGSQSFDIRGNGVYTAGTDIRLLATAQQAGTNLQVYFPLYNYTAQ